MTNIENAAKNTAKCLWFHLVMAKRLHRNSRRTKGGNFRGERTNERSGSDQTEGTSNNETNTDSQGSGSSTTNEWTIPDFQAHLATFIGTITALLQSIRNNFSELSDGDASQFLADVYRRLGDAFAGVRALLESHLGAFCNVRPTRIDTVAAAKQRQIDGYTEQEALIRFREQVTESRETNTILEDLVEQEINSYKQKNEVSIHGSTDSNANDTGLSAYKCSLKTPARNKLVTFLFGNDSKISKDKQLIELTEKEYEGRVDELFKRKKDDKVMQFLTL